MLMRFVYSVSMTGLQLGLRVVAMWHGKASEMVNGRKNWAEDLRTNRPEGRLAWFHCASVGEFEQAKPVIELIKASKPDLKIAITVYSPSGYIPAKKYKYADVVSYLPFDSRKNARLFVDILKPVLVVFIKYEFWYHILESVHKRKIPLFLVSAIFRPEQLFFRKSHSFFQSMLWNFDHFFVQTQSSEELLRSVGLKNVTLTGDTRVDRVLEIAKNPKDIPIAQAFRGDGPVMVVGSSWHQDMELLLPIINDETIGLKFIIAPHEIDAPTIRGISAKLKVTYTLFSQVGQEQIRSQRVLIIDNIGMLSSLYRYGDMAYVGGAFHEGLHNILEPAAFGLPVIFGRSKSNRKYQEALDMVACGGAFDIATSMELRAIILKLLHDMNYRSEVSGKVIAYVNRNAGASRKVADHLLKYI